MEERSKIEERRINPAGDRRGEFRRDSNPLECYQEAEIMLDRARALLLDAIHVEAGLSKLPVKWHRIKKLAIKLGVE